MRKYIHSSCEIEDFVALSLEAVSVTPIARITGVCILIKDIRRRLPLELACARVYRVTLINLCTASIKPVNPIFRGTTLTAVECITLSCILCMPYKGSAPRAADAPRYARARWKF